MSVPYDIISERKMELVLPIFSECTLWHHPEKVMELVLLVSSECIPHPTLDDYFSFFNNQFPFLTVNSKIRPWEVSIFSRHVSQTETSIHFGEFIYQLHVYSSSLTLSHRQVWRKQSRSRWSLLDSGTELVQRSQYSKTLELNQVNVLYSISISNKVQDAEFSLSYLETSQDTDETEMMHFSFPFCFLISVLPLSRRWLQRSPHPLTAATLPKDDPPQISSAPTGIAVTHATSIHSHSSSPVSPTSWSWYPR